ncbi:MAG: hypothetical protein KQA41_01740 [Candidatus Aenigmarchaeota archaeon]|nr:hypothetical protein [Candidatus Aenigmarchaeota archaeon]
MKYLIIFLLLFAFVSAKVLKIEGDTRDFYTGKAINGSFLILPKGEKEKNVSGEIIDGKWQAEIDINEQKTSKILVITNTSSKIGFNIFGDKHSKTQCAEKIIKIKPFVLNTTPINLLMEIEGVNKNFVLIHNAENAVSVCLETGEIYKINLIADGGKGYFSFFYPVK